MGAEGHRWVREDRGVVERCAGGIRRTEISRFRCWVEFASMSTFFSGVSSLPVLSKTLMLR